MIDLTIDKIKTGKGLAGSRVALIFAPPNAPPGSMHVLTRFLNQQLHLRAIPGYHGPDKNHVLRVSGLKDDAHFLHMLQETFPKWQAANSDEAQTNLQFAQNIQFEPLDEVDHFPHQPVLQRFVKENANTFTALAYMVGNVGLFYSAMRKPQGGNYHPKCDWFKLYSAAAYTAGTVTLLVMGQKKDNPRDVYTIIEELYPKLKTADAAQQAHVHSSVEQAINFMQNHPWEISSGIWATGSLAHLTSAVMRNQKGANSPKFEALAAAGTLTAMLISALVPEKEGRDIADLGSIFEPRKSDSTLAALEAMQESEHYKGQSANTFERFSNWLQESPLAVSAGIQAISNTAYGVAALSRKPIDPGLFATSASFLTGNALQTQATKGRGPGFDDVVTAAAAMLHSDPLLQNKSKGELDRYIARFAEALAEEHEVMHKQGRMAHAIKSRLERYALPREEENAILTGFIDSEKEALQNNPFLRPRYVDKALRSTDNAAAAPTAP